MSNPSRNVSAFALATSTAAMALMTGCATVDGIKQDIGIKSSTTTTTAQAQTQAQKISPVLHPAVQSALDDIGQKRGQSFNASAKCSDSQLAGNGNTLATNRYNNGNAGKQVENAIGGVINQGLGKAGRFGQIAKPTVDGIRSSSSEQANQLQTVCGRIGQVNARFINAETLPDNQKTSIYQQGYSNLTTAMTLASNARLTDGAVGTNGVDAINQRGLNRSQTVFWTQILNGVYTPKSNGGAFGDILNKLTPNR